MAVKKKKKKLEFKNILIFFLVFVILGLIIYFVLTMPIHNIYIKNNNIVSDDEIIQVSGLENYPSFLLTRGSSIQKKLKKNKYIENVKVKKEFGNVIQITVYEYQMIAVTRDNLIILSNGMKIDNSYDLSDVPVLINEINNEQIYKIFAEKFGKIDKNILRQISEVEYSPVEVDEERFLLYMNDGNLVYVTLTKIEKLNKYNSIKDKLENKKGIIYLDAGDYVELKG